MINRISSLAVIDITENITEIDLESNSDQMCAVVTETLDLAFLKNPENVDIIKKLQIGNTIRVVFVKKQFLKGKNYIQPKEILFLGLKKSNSYYTFFGKDSLGEEIFDENLSEELNRHGI